MDSTLVPPLVWTNWYVLSFFTVLGWASLPVVIPPPEHFLSRVGGTCVFDFNDGVERSTGQCVTRRSDLMRIGFRHRLVCSSISRLLDVEYRVWKSTGSRLSCLHPSCPVARRAGHRRVSTSFRSGLWISHHALSRFPVSSLVRPGSSWMKCRRFYTEQNVSLFISWRWLDTARY